jgi:2-hydroxychromene-2-carboxylate isomerase
MAARVEFFFDVVSPASYLAWTQMPELARQTGAEIDYRPFFLPDLFKEAGSASPISVPAKGKWLFQDLKRFAGRYGVPFRMNRHFPVNSVNMMRALEAFRGRPQFLALGDAFMDAMWVSDLDVKDEAVMAELVSKAGIDPQEYSAIIADPAIKQKLADSTSEAARRGAFGAPTFFVGKFMHWGQDRLDFVREDLLAQTG